MRKFVMLAFFLTVLATSQAHGRGGTREVAWKGRPADISASWPVGVGALLADPDRTDGWNPYFSGYPNDVNHYGFDIEGVEDLNRIIQELAACECKVRKIQLSPEKEPTSLGFASRLPKGNEIACLFSIGDQSALDQFYATASGTLPIAMPPTLTIYVQNAKVDLRALEIPDSIAVSAGSIVAARRPLDAASNSTADRIAKFLSARKEKSSKTKR